MPADLILFDLDGTLSDPQLGIARSINYALTAHGYPARQAQDLLRYIGPPLDESFQDLTGSRDAERIRALVATLLSMPSA